MANAIDIPIAHAWRCALRTSSDAHYYTLSYKMLKSFPKSVNDSFADK